MDDTLRIVVVDDQPHETETIANALRNAGHKLRAQHVEESEELLKLLAGESWDLILSNTTASKTPPKQTLEIANQHGNGASVVLIGGNTDDKSVFALFSSGASDAIDTSDTARLVHTVVRECQNTRTRHALKQREQSLKETIERAQLLVDSSRDAITYIHDGMHIYSNESYQQMFGCSDLDKLAGTPILNMVVNADHGKFKEYLRGYLSGKLKEETIEVVGLKEGGEVLPIKMEFSSASYDGESCIQIIIRDRSIDEDLALQLANITKSDQITGVYNRNYFLEQLLNLTSKSKQNGAILLITPDGFDKSRSSLGIASSDTLLKSIAGKLDEQLTAEKDLLARFEGEQFTAIIHGKKESDVKSLADKMVSAIGETVFDIDGNSLTVTCSIGVSLITDGMRDYQEVLNRAEKALSKANDSGGGCAKLYTPDASEMAAVELVSVKGKQIRQALRENRFYLVFQPIVSLLGGEMDSYEAFLRMRGEKGEEILPREFLDAAEQTGLMINIDRWILANAVKKSALEKRRGKKLHLFVKISGESLTDTQLLPWLQQLLKAAHLGDDMLTIEISEKIAGSNLNAMKGLQKQLQKLHVGMAIDHFGTASNSANLLKHSGAQAVKLDMSLITAIGNDNVALEKVRRLTTQAKEQNIKTIAVAVEDPNTLSTIYSSGIEYIQGNFLRPPEPNMDFDFSTT